MKLPLRNLFISSLSTSALLAGTAAVYVNDGGGDDDDKEDDDGIHKTPSIKNKCSEKRKLKKAEKECKDFIEKMRERNAIPGLVVGVSLKGKDIWVKGFGYSDLESGTKCKPDTVMRIASISKSITMILVAKLIEEGKLDLDASIHKYLTEDQFPKKKWEGNSVDITLRQLVSHLGGIRHYKKDDNKLNQIKPDEHGGGEFAASEYYIREKFASVFDSLKLFKDDELIAKPGSKHLYTTHGFTLISAIVESVLPKKEQFGTYLIENICHKDLGMKDTCLDEYEPIIYNRSKNYIKINGKLCNAPYVENSYKWAGGGLLSTVPDLLKFGKIMLYSFKGGNSNKTLSGYLKSSTVDQLWSPVDGTKRKSDEWTKYGMGWVVIRNGQPKCAYCAEPAFPNVVYHTGAAVGASSILMINPDKELIITVIANLQEAPDLGTIAIKVAKTIIRHLEDD